MRQLISVLALLLSSVLEAAAANLGQPSLAISRGTTYHLVQIEDAGELIWRANRYPVSYLPAGTLLEIYDQYDARSKNRKVIRTEFGQFGFVDFDEKGLISGDRDISTLRGIIDADRDAFIIVDTVNVAGVSLTNGEGPYRGVDNGGEAISLDICRTDHATKFSDIAKALGPAPSGCFTIDAPRNQIRRIDTTFLKEAFDENWITRGRVLKGVFPTLIQTTPFDAVKNCLEKRSFEYSKEVTETLSGKISAAFSGIGFELGGSEQIKSFAKSTDTYEGKYDVFVNVDFLIDENARGLFEKLFVYRDDNCSEQHWEKSFEIQGRSGKVLADELASASMKAVSQLDGSRRLIFDSRRDFETWYDDATRRVQRANPELIPPEIYWVISRIATIRYSKQFMRN
jgi:hypothetical protein